MDLHRAPQGRGCHLRKPDRTGLALLDELREEHRDRGICIDEVAGGFAFRTNSVYSKYVRGFLAQRPVRHPEDVRPARRCLGCRQLERVETRHVGGQDSSFAPPLAIGAIHRKQALALWAEDSSGNMVAALTGN